jgi:hypothetical protein
MFEALKDWWWNFRNGEVVEVLVAGHPQDFEVLNNFRMDLIRDMELPVRLLQAESCQIDNDHVEIEQGKNFTMTFVHESGMMSSYTVTMETKDGTQKSGGEVQSSTQPPGHSPGSSQSPEEGIPETQRPSSRRLFCLC